MAEKDNKGRDMDEKDIYLFSAFKLNLKRNKKNSFMAEKDNKGNKHLGGGGDSP